MGFRSKRATAALVAILVMGAASVVAGRVIQAGGAASLDAAAARAHRGDFVLWGHGDTLRQIAIDTAKGAPTSAAQASAVGEVRALSSVEIIAPDGVSELALLSQLPASVTDNGRKPIAADVDLPLLRAGAFPSDANSVAVEPGVAKVGDTLHVQRGGVVRQAKVTGIVVDFFACGYPTCRPGHIFATTTGFERLADFKILPSTDSTLSITTLPGSGSAERLAQWIHTSHPGTVNYHLSWVSMRGQMLAPDDALGAFVSGFGLFLLLVAATTIFGAVSAQMVSRRRDYAIISTLGATPTQLALSVVAEHLALAIVGGLIGWCVGSGLAPLARATVARSIGWGGPVFSFAQLLEAESILCLLMIAVCGLAALRVHRNQIVAELRNEGSAGKPRATWALRLPNVVAALGLQDPFTRPLRTLFAFIGLVLAMSGAFAAVGMRSTVGYLVSDGGRAGGKFDVSMWSMDNTPNSELAKQALHLPGVQSVFTTRTDPASLATGHSGYSASAVVQSAHQISLVSEGGDPTAVSVNVVHGRRPAKPGEGIASTTLLRESATHVGDVVQVTAYGHSMPVRIVGSYREGGGGERMRIRLAQLQAVAPKTTDGSVVMLLKPGVNKRSVLRAIQKEYGYSVQTFVSRGVAEEAGAVRWVLLIIGALTVFAALAQMAGAWLAGAREQAKDASLLEAIGFTRAQLQARSAIGSGMVGLVAWIVAIPVGYVTLRAIGRPATARAGLDSDVLIYAAWHWLAAAGVAVVALSALLGAATTAMSRQNRPATTVL